MFSPAFRFLLVLAGLALARAAFERGSVLGWAYLAGAALIAVGFWRSGSVWLAWRACAAGDFRRMERRLRWTRPHRWLGRRERAYYHLLRGVAARRRGDMAEARRHLSAAVEGPLDRPADRSYAYGELAEVALESGDPHAAAAAVTTARGLNPPLSVAVKLADIDGRLRG